MYVLDDTSKIHIVERAHKEARRDLLNSLEFENIMEEGIAEACSQYKSCFLNSLLKEFNHIKHRSTDARLLPIKRLLDRLAEKGVTEHSVTTPPLCLTVKYKGLTLSFSYDYDGSVATVDGFEVRVPNWDEDIIELLEAIHAELRESSIFSKAQFIIDEFMSEKVQKDIMISTALGIIRSKLIDIEYEIISKHIEDEVISIRISTRWQAFLIEGTFEEFANNVDEKFLEIKEVISSNNGTDFEYNDYIE